MNAGERPAAWREGALEGDDSPYAGTRAVGAGPDYRTLTYEVTGRVARITFNRPDQGNAITNDTPVDLAHAVERPTWIRVCTSSSVRAGQGVLRRLRPHCVRRERRRSTRGCSGHDRNRARPGRADGQPRSRGHLGPDGRLRDDEPLQPRLRQPAAREQAHRREAARVRRRGRVRHRLVRRPDHLRRRRPDRLPAHPRVGRSGRRDVGAPRRRRPRQADAVHRRVHRRTHRGRLGPGGRVVAGRRAGRAHRGTRREDRAAAGQPADDGQARPQQRAARPGRRDVRDGQHGVRRRLPPHPRGLRVPAARSHRRVPRGRPRARRGIRRRQGESA